MLAKYHQLQDNIVELSNFSESNDKKLISFNFKKLWKSAQNVKPVQFNSPNKLKVHEQSSDTSNLSAEINEGKYQIDINAFNTEGFNPRKN